MGRSYFGRGGVPLKPGGPRPAAIVRRGPARLTLPALAAVGFLVLLLAAATGISQPSVLTLGQPLGVDSVTVRTTTHFSFVPDQIVVVPGALVQLEVIQGDVTPHTFVLLSVANFSLPTSDTPAQVFAFLNAHHPLVNLSIPGTVGAQVFDNFTAPALGTYEFLCEIAGHFQSGMFGFLYSGTSPPSSGAGGFNFLDPLVLGGLAGGLVVVVVIVVVVLRLRSRRAPPAGPAGPKEPKST